MLICTKVGPTATEQELKKAYKMNALKYHPGAYTLLQFLGGQ
jgi:DnaJ-class molecular chaperone